MVFERVFFLFLFRVRTIDTTGRMDAVQPLTLLHKHPTWSRYSGNSGSSPCSGRDADKRLVKPPMPAFPMVTVVGQDRSLPENRPLVEGMLVMRKTIFAVLMATSLLAVQFGCQGCPSRCSCRQAAATQPEPAMRAGQRSGEQQLTEEPRAQSVLVR
jgi:hypothetical protein